MSVFSTRNYLHLRRNTGFLAIFFYNSSYFKIFIIIIASFLGWRVIYLSLSSDVTIEAKAFCSNSNSCGGSGGGSGGNSSSVTSRRVPTTVRWFSPLWKVRHSLPLIFWWQDCVEEVEGLRGSSTRHFTHEHNFRSSLSCSISRHYHSALYSVSPTLSHQFFQVSSR